jgi:hypothetical protein
MKRLLWMMSIACFLPAVTGLPSQASSINSVKKLEQIKVIAQAPTPGINPSEAPAPAPPAPGISPSEAPVIAPPPAPSPSETPVQPASEGVRLFLRSAQPCNCGGAAEQAELEKVKAEAAAFLESVKNPNASQLGQAKPTGGTSVSSPTW